MYDWCKFLLAIQSLYCILHTSKSFNPTIATVGLNDGPSCTQTTRFAIPDYRMQERCFHVSGTSESFPGFTLRQMKRYQHHFHRLQTASRERLIVSRKSWTTSLTTAARRGKVRSPRSGFSLPVMGRRRSAQIVQRETTLEPIFALLLLLPFRYEKEIGAETSPSEQCVWEEDCSEFVRFR